LHSLGKSVLIIDTDPQANATLGLGVYPETIQRSIYQYYLHRCNQTANEISISEYIIKTISGIDLVPSHLDLIGAEPLLYQFTDRYYILSSGIAPLKSRYDYILIDTPPFLGQFVLNAMIAADRSVVVFSPDTFALAGYNHLLLIINDISEMLGRKVKIDMAILNRWPRLEDMNETFLDKIHNLFRKKSGDETDGEQEIRDQLEKRVKMEIPETVIVPEGRHISQSIKQGVPLVVLSPNDPSLQGFREAASIIDGWR